MADAAPSPESEAFARGVLGAAGLEVLDEASLAALAEYRDGRVGIEELVRRAVSG